MNTSRITRDLHVHKPEIRSLMTYADTQGKRVSNVLDLRDPKAVAVLVRTLKWAAHNGVEVIIRPC